MAKLYQKSFEYASLPYEQILKTLGLPSSTSLQISFQFHTNSINSIQLHNAQLQPLTHNSYASTDGISKFDLSLTVYHDQYENMLSFTIDGSSDLYNQSTIQDLSHRFHLLCQQLFCSSSFDLKRQPIYEISLLLPIEQDLIQQLNNQSNIGNEKSVHCIHEVFIKQAMKHRNKIAITLDDQCLTYQELLTRVQHLSFLLINEKNVVEGDVICQCIDRSIEMIIGMMSISCVVYLFSIKSK